MVFNHLTDRQVDLLQRMCAGQTEADIASDLSLALSTIRRYRDTIFLGFGKTPLSTICQMLATDGSAQFTRNTSVAVSTKTADQFPEYRVEHHAGDGTIRLLASSGVQSMANGSALSWARLLRRQTKDGTVVVVDSRTEVTIVAVPLASS